MLRNSGVGGGGAGGREQSDETYLHDVCRKNKSFWGVTGTKNTLGFQVLIEVKINNGIKKVYMKPQVHTQ